MNCFPLIAVILRSVVPLRDKPIQVCGLPSRFRLSMSMNFTHAAVVGRRIEIVSPTANPLASATVMVEVPEGT